MRMKAPCHPGEILRSSIEEGLGLTITAVAKGLGISRKTLSEIVNERSGISPEMAIRLEKGIGSTAEQWLLMQAAYDLAQVQKRASKIRVRRIQRA